MNIEIYLSSKNNFQDYSMLISNEDKKEIILYFENEINIEMLNFNLSAVVEEKNQSKILNAKSLLKDDFFQSLSDINLNTNREDVYKDLGNFLIILIKTENNSYVFLKDFTQNFVINKSKLISLGDSIKLITENSKNIPLDWDLAFEMKEDVVYVKSFKKLTKWLKVLPNDEHIKNFNIFVDILKNKGIKLKKENSSDFTIDKQRKKDLSLVNTFNFSIEDLKKYNFIDSQNYLYKTKINETIAYIVDKMYYSTKSNIWYVSDTSKVINIDEGSH